MQRCVDTGQRFIHISAKKRASDAKPMPANHKTTLKGGVKLPKRKTGWHRNAEVRLWYEKQPWDELWHEFIGGRKEDGELRWQTAWQFCSAKWKIPKYRNQRDWMFRCIGPKPIDLGEFKLKIKTGGMQSYELPYLGDWQAMRASAYFNDNTAVTKLRTVMKERLDGLEASRASAHFVLDLIAKWAKYDDEIDRMYSASMPDKNASIGVKDRFYDRFFKQKNRTRSALQGLTTQFMLCHGIGPDHLSDFGNLVLAISKGSAQSFLAGQAVGAAPQLPPALMRIAEAIQEKSKTFNMPLPDAFSNGHAKKEEIEIKVESTKGTPANGHR